MISPDMFQSTEMEISEKWDRSSANYISENWKRNNEHLTMLSKTAKLGYLCWNRIKWCRFWDTDITVDIDGHKKKKRKKKEKEKKNIFFFYSIPLVKAAETWFLSWH